MSRCVRFPPQGLVWKGASGEALIELLQARREKVAAEKRRKEKKKRRKKEDEELEEGEIREKKRSKHKHKMHMKSNESDDYKKLVLELESSNLTEEHEQPIGDHNSLSDSTDNTEKARPKYAILDKFGLPASTSTTPVDDDKAESSLQHVESQFRDLSVNNAAPFPTQIDHFHNQGWLFERRLSRRHPPAVFTACNENDSCLESSSFYPCLRYLPQTGIYALPYTMWF